MNIKDILAKIGTTEGRMSAKGQTQRRTSSVEMLLLRDRLGYKGYRKTAKRDPEKRRLLLELALEKIARAEQDNYTLIGPRRRRVRFPAR